MLAIGSPFQLSQTVTAGIVSATGRTNVGFADYEDFIQTDAAINPGNSGGALVNSRGELVGINTGIFSESGGYQGIGFAVPSNLARQGRRRSDEVRRGAPRVGRLSPGRAVDRAIARDVGAPITRGALVSRMVRDSESYEAGLRPGDVIVEFNGQPVDDPSQFFRLVADAKVGSTASLKVLRNGREMELQAADRLEPRDSASKRGAAALERLPRFPPAFEFLEPAAEPDRLGHPPRHHVHRLVAVPGDADDRRFVRADDARGARARSVAASVVPPAGSVKMPSVSASSWIASRICLSLTAAPVPPVERTDWST